MPRFEYGDRVQVIGDIARFYKCVVGAVIADERDAVSEMNQYKVRLADGSESDFFDFQLQSPAVMTGRLIEDSGQTAAGRELRFSARNIYIHLEIKGSAEKSVVGVVKIGSTVLPNALVTAWNPDRISAPAVSNNDGEFTFQDVAPGEIRIEVFVPTSRILVSLVV
jgi:hypothetical protein